MKPWKGPKKCELFSLLRRRAGIRNTLVFYSPTPKSLKRSEGQVRGRVGVLSMWLGREQAKGWGAHFS